MDYLPESARETPGTESRGVHLSLRAQMATEIVQPSNATKTRDLCTGMVESRQKSSDSGEAGSQQGCPYQRTLGKDMWVRSLT